MRGPRWGVRACCRPRGSQPTAAATSSAERSDSQGATAPCWRPTDAARHGHEHEHTACEGAPFTARSNVEQQRCDETEGQKQRQHGGERRRRQRGATVVPPPWDTPCRALPQQTPSPSSARRRHTWSAARAPPRPRFATLRHQHTASVATSTTTCVARAHQRLRAPRHTGRILLPLHTLLVPLRGAHDSGCRRRDELHAAALGLSPAAAQPRDGRVSGSTGMPAGCA